MVLKQLIFKHFLLWLGVVVLGELISNSFYFGGGCGGLKRTAF